MTDGQKRAGVRQRGWLRLHGAAKQSAAAPDDTGPGETGDGDGGPAAGPDAPTSLDHVLRHADDVRKAEPDQRA